MNELFNLNADEAELMDIGKQVGADVPFCIKGGTMLSEGIGRSLQKSLLLRSEYCIGKTQSRRVDSLGIQQFKAE